jgi:predicted nuclease of predicted toxin-antitoxin system
MVRFYFDEHMRRAVEKGLTRLGHEIVMAVDVGMEGKDDDTEHLPYAQSHNLVLVTFDRPFAGRTISRTDHSGLICLSEDMREDIGRTIRVLAEFADKYSSEDAVGQVFWLR